MWEKAKKIRTTKEQTEELKKLIRGRNTPQKIVFRAKIIVEAIGGESNNKIAKKLNTSRETVISWRKRFIEKGVEGIKKDAPGRGRKPTITKEKIKEVVEATLNTKPINATHWSTRSMAKAQGISNYSVHQIWRAYNLKPHLIEKFKFSNDKNFVEKVEDIVGLYMNPPDKAIVLSVDEKSQIQALERTQPELPLRPGLPARQTHDYKRNGITTLFAALNILDGKVIGKCYQRHRHQEFLKFLKEIDKEIPKEIELHLVTDNYSTRKHPKVNRWLRRHKRFHLHFTPTGASWLNMVEVWLSGLTDKRIRRGSFRSVKELTLAIYEYIRNYNENAKPFVWKADVKSILNKINYCKDNLKTRH